ncbi:hypothetical protein AcV7_005920 [Taiwanofungus camphoratus]|nr:hypothetical protein AcV7_005920 [Antrodia cinnamomea]
MPRAASNAPRARDSVSPSNIHVLRRNQACHQCRKRKLKCDAKRPCSTCVRSHAYAVAHAPAGATMPLHPDCTFDAVPDINFVEQQEPPKSRFEKLESKINELEALLKDKEKGKDLQESVHTEVTPEVQLPTRTDPSMSGDVSASLTGILNFGTQDLDQPMRFTGNSMNLNNFQIGTPLDNLADAAILIDNPRASRITTPLSHKSSTDAIEGVASISPGPDPALEILSIAWPRNLPDPDLLRHLVDAYFSFNPDACRLFHKPTFLSSLSYPPTHPSFPMTGLLHAMCAMGSLYTAAVAPAPPAQYLTLGPDDYFDGKRKALDRRPDSFAEVQAKCARRALDDAIDVGEDLFQSVQAKVLLSTWYWASAKWSEGYMCMASMLGATLPLGLNVCSPFQSLSQTLRPPSVLPPSKSVMEDELRRNTFWLGYTLERTMGSGHGWALLLDDQDISQLLPIRGDQFEQGVFVLHNERQWSQDPGMLLRHPDGQTDPFILYIKSSVLLSRVKNFNSRFRAKYYAGDPSVVSYYDTAQGMGHMEPKDIRSTHAFIELDQLIIAFQACFPAHFRSPVQDNTVNPHLFSACTAPFVAQILLHESHAHIGHPTCTSSLKVLNAARSILNLVYDVCATSYDLALLGPFSLLVLYMTGKVLARFLHVAIDSHSEELSAPLCFELEFIRMMLSNVGERIPLAHRYGKMLDDYVRQQCGDRYAEPITSGLPPRTGLSPVSAADAWYSSSKSLFNQPFISVGPLLS